MTEVNETTQLAQRAEAAEKTVAVLKRRVKALYNGDTTAIARQLERARQRQEKARQRQELMRVKTDELEKYSKTLEREVALRTRDMQTILDNVTFGFLVVGPDLVIKPGFTESCRALLGADSIAGKRLTELLPCAGATVRAELELGVDQLFEDILPEELSVAQLPQRYGFTDGRVLQVEPSVIRCEDSDEVEALLFTISDITSLEAAKREANVNKVLVGLLKRRESFQHFLVDARLQLGAAVDALQLADAATARRAIHTIKGNAVSFGLDEVSALIHEVEGEETLTPGHIARVEGALRTFLDRHSEVLEMSLDTLEEAAFEVSLEHLSELKAISKTMGRAEAGTLLRWRSEILLKPVRVMTGPVEEFVARLADRLDKRVDFQFSGADTLVDAELLRPVIQNLTHLLRNAIDHGIESPDERGDKEEVGHLVLSVDETEGAYQIRLSDDGRGIDVGAVGDQALRRGFVDEQALESMNDKERLELVFRDGLSTAREATEISGRGVGMSALMEQVQRVHGRIDVDSAPGQGVSVTLHIPKPELSSSATAAE